MNADQPAYPQHGWTNDPKILDRMRHQSGLTKREEFAKSAMQGFLGSPDYLVLLMGDTLEWEKRQKTVARTSVELADALLAELAKEKTL